MSWDVFHPKGEVSCLHVHMGLPSRPAPLLLVSLTAGLQPHFPHGISHTSAVAQRNHFTWRRFDSGYIMGSTDSLKNCITTEVSLTEYWNSLCRGSAKALAGTSHRVWGPPTRCGIFWTSRSYMVLCLSNKNIVQKPKSRRKIDTSHHSQELNRGFCASIPTMLYFIVLSV